MSSQGSSRQPDSWITLNRVPAERSAHIGVRLIGASDAVTVVLPGGNVLHIYGSGQIWSEGTSRYFTVHDEEIDWR